MAPKKGVEQQQHTHFLSEPLPPVVGQAFATFRHPEGNSCPLAGQLIERSFPVHRGETSESIWKNQFCATHHDGKSCIARLEMVDWMYSGEGE